MNNVSLSWNFTRTDFWNLENQILENYQPTEYIIYVSDCDSGKPMQIDPSPHFKLTPYTS